MSYLPQDATRRDEEQARLDARRAAIRERIVKQHAISAKLAEERSKAEEAARANLARFRTDKPLYEKLQEEYERQQAALEAEKKRLYDEEAKNKLVRPRQIMSGQVQIKPAHPREQPSPPRGGFGTSVGSGGAAAVSPKGSHAPRRRSLGAEGATVPDEEGGVGVEGAGPSASKASVKPRVQGMVLYSTRLKQQQSLPGMPGGGRGHLLPQLVERAVSPFIFGADGLPINVPSQDTYLTSSAGGAHREANGHSEDAGAEVLQVEVLGAAAAGVVLGGAGGAMALAAARPGSNAASAAAAATPAVHADVDVDDSPQMESPTAAGGDAVELELGREEPSEPAPGIEYSYGADADAAAAAAAGADEPAADAEPEAAAVAGGDGEEEMEAATAAAALDTEAAPEPEAEVEPAAEEEVEAPPAAGGEEAAVADEGAEADAGAAVAEAPLPEAEPEAEAPAEADAPAAEGEGEGEGEVAAAVEGGEAAAAADKDDKQ